MNRPTPTLVLLAILCAGSIAAGAGTPEAPATMRVDYYHTGNALTETFSLHRVVIEPLPWPGTLEKPVDTTNRGFFLLQIEHPVTGNVLYSRGFSSIFQEWQTTSEARRMNRTFHESVRFPMPDEIVRLRIMKRDDRNAFATIWTTEIDPHDMLVVRTHAPSRAEMTPILESGPPSEKVDLLFLGDGYGKDEREKFLADARRLSAELLAVSPFADRRTDFNVWALMEPAPESGVNRPSTGTFRYSPTGTTYDAFRSERYILAFDNQGLRELAQHAPYEFMIILANGETYGGGGIFGLYSTVAADSEWAPYLTVHEFGHHFAALADEYYTSSTAYESSDARPEPWEPNVTALHDPAQLKWRSMVESGTPLPTPWPKDEFEAFQRTNQENRRKLRAENRPESEMNELFHAEQAFVEDLLSADTAHSSAVGAFEGANYAATGYFRSQMNCIMFTRHDAFCDVCSRAIEEIIDLYTGD